MYAQVADLVARLGKSYEAIYKASDAPALEDLAQASAEMDGFLGGRYLVPVTAPAALPLLRGWALNLAEAAAYKRAGANTIPEKVKDAAAVTRGLLKQVAQGSFVVPGTPVESPSGAGGAVCIECDQPVMTRDQLSGY